MTHPLPEPSHSGPHPVPGTDLHLPVWSTAQRDARAQRRGRYLPESTAHPAKMLRYVEAHAHSGRGRRDDLAAARTALEDATRNGPRTSWFRRLERTIADLEGQQAAPASDADRIFLAWDEWRRETGTRIEQALSQGRAAPGRP